ncbi:MAG: hypothetical protein J1F42_09475 [Lachnospiraceae bacterium]|nr:hypothetical protein [Lachnospiraceae bacterium]
MHKDGKWAKQLISLQDNEGKWGCFHSLSQFYNAPITTEQALRRLECLGYTIEDECIQKAVSYMDDCLIGKNTIPDRREKVHDWDIFTSMILSTWIRRFTHDNPHANKVAGQWGNVISAAFSDGTFDYDEYVRAYHEILGLKPKGGRLIDFVNFYPISLLNDCLDKKTQEAVMDYVLDRNNGIYYIYDKKISVLPQFFESREASRYLAAIELLARYKHARHKLYFVIDWLNDNKNENGKWDMGKSVNDKMYFPLSDDWRKKETREADCTERIVNLITAISN